MLRQGHWQSGQTGAVVWLQQYGNLAHPFVLRLPFFSCVASVPINVHSLVDISFENNLCRSPQTMALGPHVACQGAGLLGVFFFFLPTAACPCKLTRPGPAVQCMCGMCGCTLKLSSSLSIPLLVLYFKCFYFHFFLQNKIRAQEFLQFFFLNYSWSPTVLDTVNWPRPV